MDMITYDYDTKLSAFDLILIRNGYENYCQTDQCTEAEKNKIRKEIYELNLLIEVKTVQAHRNLGIEFTTTGK